MILYEPLRVTCALIEKDGFVLITQRSESMPDSLRWEFPGGKMEPDETEEACLVREIKEELDVLVYPQTRMTPVLHSLQNGNTLELIPYRCLLAGGTIRLQEHKAFRWAQPEDLPGFNWCVPDLPIVAEYLRLLKRV